MKRRRLRARPMTVRYELQRQLIARQSTPMLHSKASQVVEDMGSDGVSNL
jgi:hypothetical protein